MRNGYDWGKILAIWLELSCIVMFENTVFGAPGLTAYYAQTDIISIRLISPGGKGLVEKNAEKQEAKKQEKQPKSLLLVSLPLASGL